MSIWYDIETPTEPGFQFDAEELNKTISSLNYLHTPPQGLYELSTAASNVTTTSTSMVALGSFEVTFTSQRGLIDIYFNARVGGSLRFDFLVNGFSISGDTDGVGGGASLTQTSISLYRQIACGVGSVTVSVQFRATTGTATLYAAGKGQLFAKDV